MSCDLENDPFSFGKSSGGCEAADAARTFTDIVGFILFHIFLKKYRFDATVPEPHGSGTFGKVYLGIDLETGEPLAVKKVYFGPPTLRIPKPPSLDEIVREAQIGMSLDSPHLCKVYGFSVNDDFVYIAMECINGVEAFDYFNQKENSSLCETNPHLLQRIFIDIARGLLDLHRGGFAHRDIKFENVMIVISKGEFIRAVIIDFGFTMRVSEIPPSSQQGTIEYSAPEIIQKTPMSEKVDIWALGVMLFLIIFRKFPIQSAHFTNLFNEKRYVYEQLMRLSESIQLPPYTGDDENVILFRQICARCLVFDQSARISAEELLAMLSS